MTKKHIFTTAHKIAKGIVKEVGNYQLALQLALKEVYNTTKNVLEIKQFQVLSTI